MKTLNWQQRAASSVMALAMLLLGLFAPAALAQADDPAPAVPDLIRIDTSGDTNYAIVRTFDGPRKAEISANGEPGKVTGISALTDTDPFKLRTMLVIDTSATAGEQLEAFRAAATNYLAKATPNEEIGIYTTGGKALLRIGLTDNHARVQTSIDKLATSAGASKLWDAVRAASLDLGDRDLTDVNNLVVMSASEDALSTTTATQARGAAISANASIFALAYNGGTAPIGPLERLVTAVPGGAFASTPDNDVVAAYGDSLSSATNGTWAITFEADSISAGNDLTLTLDGVAIDASYVNGSITSGAALAPYIAPPANGIGFLQGGFGKLIVVLSATAAVVLGGYAIVSLFGDQEQGLTSLLRPYSDEGVAADGRSSAISKSEMFKRAVNFTEGFAERQGVLKRSEAVLERADMPLRAAEALTFYFGIVVAGFVVGFLLTQSIVPTLIVAALSVVLPPIVVKFKAGRRQKAFSGQLPDTLQLLSSTLKAGYSFLQGVEAVSIEVSDPMGGELRRVITEAQLGRPVEEALDSAAERMDSPDFAWAVMAVRIQREVGGNLSELLMTVSETMTHRERLRRDVAALTAEGKMSAIVLAALPLLLGIAMYTLNPEYMATLFEETLGNIILGVSIVAALIGFAWMFKIIDIEI